MRKLNDFFKNEPKKSLYHYTGIGALLGIADSETLWASNIYYLNDGQEIIYAQKKLRRLVAEKQGQVKDEMLKFLNQFYNWLEPIAPVIPNLFVFSLSEKQNLLSQWRSYTPHGRGVSIGFSSFILRKIAEENSLEIAKCRYNNNEQFDVINTLLEEIIISFEHYFSNQNNLEDLKKHHPTQKYYHFLEQFRGDMLRVFSIIKHPAFEEEQEWRLISSYFPNYTVPEINYREGASMLVPYIKLKLKRWHDIPQHTHPVLFENVCLGPSQHSALSFNALSQFLSNKRVTHETFNSNIPYRKL